MQCFISFWVAVALSLASVAASASAQAPDQEGNPSGLRRWHPNAYVDPASGETFSEQPASGLDIEYVPQSAKRSPEEIRVQRSKAGVGVSAVPLVVGAIVALAEVRQHAVPFSGGSDQPTHTSAVYAGVAVAAAGAVSMIANGAVLAKRKRELRESERTSDRRVRWDITRSRLVF